MKKHIPLYFLASLFLCQVALTQTPVQEVIQLIELEHPSEQEWKKLSELGIDLRCGVGITENGISLQVSKEEVEWFQQQAITFKILEENLIDSYRESEEELNQSRTDIELDKSRAQSNFSSIQLLSNYTQPEDCAEEDIITPSNFFLTSTNFMNGNLTLSEMEADLDDMYDQYGTGNTFGNPEIISQKTALSTTFTPAQGETMWVVRMSNNPEVQDNTKPQTIITAMHHAREPVGMMSVIFSMWYMLENYETDPFIKNLIDHHEIYFVPCMNPDGYQFNVTNRQSGGAGFWRKNRSGNGCTGVDTNRNYPVSWGTGASSSCGSSTYRGPFAMSEQENLAIQEFLVSHNIDAAMNSHTTIPALFHPYADGSTPPSNIDQFVRWAHDMTRYNRFLYADGLLEGLFGAVGGESDDFMFDNYGVMAFTPELSSSGSFWPSSSAIIPDSKEFLRAHLTLIAYSGIFGHLHDLTPQNITSTTGNLQFGIERLGATDGNFTLEVTPVSSNIQSISNGTQTITNPAVLDIDNNRRLVGYSLDPSIQNGEAIIFNVRLSNGSYDVYSGEIFKIFNGTTFASDSFDGGSINSSNWNINGWSIDSGDSFSGTGSASTGSYTGTVTRTLEWASPLDLTAVDTAALQFYSKWDIEKQWDYFVVETSTNNGSSWQELCGDFSKPGSPSSISTVGGNSNQPTGEPILDGNQQDWVLLTYDLSEFTANPSGITVPFRLRMRLVTDGTGDGTTNNGNGDGISIDEFSIVGANLTVLPVELIDFQAIKEESDVLLKWRTSSERNNEKFVLEYSMNGTDWTTFGEVAGAGTTDIAQSYSFRHIDISLAALKNVFYRIRQVDFDGLESYSSILKVDFEGKDRPSIAVNPIRRGAVVQVFGADIREVKVMGVDGVIRSVQDFDARSSAVTINTNHLPAGLYYLLVNDKDVLKLVIQ